MLETGKHKIVNRSKQRPLASARLMDTVNEVPHIYQDDLQGVQLFTN